MNKKTDMKKIPDNAQAVIDIAKAIYGDKKIPNKDLTFKLAVKATFELPNP